MQTLRDVLMVVLAAYMVYQLNSLSDTVSSLREDLTSFSGTMTTFMRNSHDYGADRIEVIERVTYPFSFCSASAATAFGMTALGFAFDITASHILCSVVEQRELLVCPGVDIVLTRDCPRLPTILNGSVTARQRAGDTVVVYGFYSPPTLPIVSLSYVGNLGEPFGRNETSFQPFTDKLNIPTDARMVSGAIQAAGLSGSAVLNGLGLVGVAVASGINQGLPTAAYVIPVKYIEECVAHHAHRLKRLSECGHVNEVLSPPRLGVV
jgi:hypothetical protein